jgi:hypothetical protein
MVLHQGLEQAAFSGIDFFIYDSLHGEHNIQLRGGSRLGSLVARQPLRY